MRTLSGADDDFEIIFGGDGFTVLIDPTDNNYIYVTAQYGTMRRSTDGGNSFQNGTEGIPDSEPNNWNTPFVFDPNNPEIIYYGTNHLYRSEDRAATWTKISDDLSKGPYFGVNPFGTITAISVSPFDANQILVGTDDGNVWITNDLGNSWENISTLLPNRWATSVCHHPDEANRFFVTFSGYRYGENSAYVYEMNYPDEGWVAISDGLPEVPVNDILIVPNKEEKVLATDVGVFISKEDSEWELLSTSLPNIITTDLDYHDIEDKLLVATYGRSLFSYTFDRSVNVEEETIKGSFKIYPNPAVSTVKIESDVIEGVQEVRILSQDGRLVKRISRHELSQAENSLDISFLSTGNYVITLKLKDGNHKSQVLIVQ